MTTTHCQRSRPATRHRRPLPALVALGIFAVSLFFPLIETRALEPANSAFQRTWARSDRPVADGRASRTWMWGPEAFSTALTEPYAEAPGGERTVQYFDKSRMEITEPDADPNADWYVTNGLLVVELITGRMQVGHRDFEQRAPADVNVAGDSDDPTGPTYRTMAGVLDAPALDEGAPVAERLARPGAVTRDASLAARGVTGARYVPETRHTVAAPFWLFMNSAGLVYRDGQFTSGPLFANPFYATGLPITEAYWAEVKVGGTYKDVLLQCFERRCLTYTPDNPEGWQVEAGNVGLHYHAWRYAGGSQPVPQPDPEPTPEPTPDPVPDPQPEPDPEPYPEPLPDPLPGPQTDYAFARTLAGPVDELNAFVSLSGIAVGPDGNLVTVDQVTERVQRYTRGGGWLGGYGGEGAGRGPTDAPMDIDVDADGNIWVLDWGNNRLVQFGDAGEVADEYRYPTFRGPLSFDIGPNGWFYVANTGADIVEIHDKDFGLRDWFGGAGGQDGRFKYVSGIAVTQSGYIYVVDQEASRVQQYDLEGKFLLQWGSAGSDPGQFKNPADVAVDAQGYVYVADFGNHRVQVFTPKGEFVREIGARGEAPGQLLGPNDVAVDNNGFLYVAGRDDKMVHKFFTTGGFVMRWGDDSRSNVVAPAGVDVDEHGSVYVIDSEQQAVKVYAPDGPFITTWDNDLATPVDLAVHDGAAYVVDEGALAVFAADGRFIERWESFGPSIPGEPELIGVDVDGDGNVYVVDKAGGRIIKLSPEGALLASWGGIGGEPGKFLNIGMVAVGDREVYVSDVATRRVQAFSLAGEFLREFTVPVDSEDRFVGWLDADGDGYVYVVDHTGSTVTKLSRYGDVVAVLTAETTGWPATESLLGIAVSGQDAIYLTAPLDGSVIMLAAIGGGSPS